MTDNTDLIARLERWENARSSVADMLLDDVRDAATALRAADAEIARLTEEADTAIQQATNMAEDVESLRAERNRWKADYASLMGSEDLRGELNERYRAAITAALAATKETGASDFARWKNARGILSDALSAPAPASQPSEAEWADPKPWVGHFSGKRFATEEAESYVRHYRPRTRAEYEQEQNR